MVGWLWERSGLHVGEAPNREDIKSNSEISSPDGTGGTIPVSMRTSVIHDHSPPASCGSLAPLSCILARWR